MNIPSMDGFTREFHPVFKNWIRSIAEKNREQKIYPNLFFEPGITLLSTPETDIRQENVHTNIFHKHRCKSLVNQT